MIPEGKYKAKAIKGTFDYSNAKGTPYVGVTFEIVDDGPSNGFDVAWYGYLTEKTEQNVSKALVALGFSGSDPEEFRTGKIENLAPNLVNIIIEHESYNGHTRERVAWVKPVGADPVKDAGFKGRMAAALAAARAESKAAPRPVQASLEDEIPF
jgi:hypothetical protein